MYTGSLSLSDAYQMIKYIYILISYILLGSRETMEYMCIWMRLASMTVEFTMYNHTLNIVFVKLSNFEIITKFIYFVSDILFSDLPVRLYQIEINNKPLLNISCHKNEKPMLTHVNIYNFVS